MQDVTITVKIPASAAMSATDVELFLAAKLYEAGKLTSGQAAEMVGLSKYDFIHLLGNYDVSFFGYDADEFEWEQQQFRKPESSST